MVENAGASRGLEGFDDNRFDDNKKGAIVGRVDNHNKIGDNDNFLAKLFRDNKTSTRERAPKLIQLYNTLLRNHGAGWSCIQYQPHAWPSSREAQWKNCNP